MKRRKAQSTRDRVARKLGSNQFQLSYDRRVWIITDLVGNELGYTFDGWLRTVHLKSGFLGAIKKKVTDWLENLERFLVSIVNLKERKR